MKKILNRFDRLMLAVTFAEAGVEAPVYPEAPAAAGSNDKHRTTTPAGKRPVLAADARG